MASTNGHRSKIAKSQDQHDGLSLLSPLLQDAEQEQPDLVSMLVHDLKAPLAVILSSLDLLDQELDGELQDVLRAARQAGQEMLQLITNLLELRYLEAGQMPICFQPLDIDLVLRAAIDQAQVVAAQDGKDLILIIPTELPAVWADVGLTSRVVNNLIENALKFTPDDSQIIVAGQVRGRELTVSVTGGPDIPVEQCARVFEQFVQGVPTLPRVNVGVGLGLAFCKMAVEIQRGRIWIENNPGPETQINFTLPVWQG